MREKGRTCSCTDACGHRWLSSWFAEGGSVHQSIGIISKLVNDGSWLLMVDSWLMMNDPHYKQVLVEIMHMRRQDFYMLDSLKPRITCLSIGSLNPVHSI